MFASLAKPDDDAELHWLKVLYISYLSILSCLLSIKDGKTRCTTGSVVSSLYHLKDTENRNEDAGFFVFPDLSVRTEGSYRLKLSLFEVVGYVSYSVATCHLHHHHLPQQYRPPLQIHLFLSILCIHGQEVSRNGRFVAIWTHFASQLTFSFTRCDSIFTPPLCVEAESTPLSCSLADQGIKIRIRKDIRVRKRPIAALTNPIEGEKADDEREDEHPNNVIPSSGSTGKRARHGHNNTINANADLPTPTSANPIALAGLPAWPTTTLDPMLGVASAPGGIELTSPTHFGSTSAGAGSTIPPPPGATYEGPKASPATIPPPPGAHIMPPQANTYEGSNTRQSAAHNRQVQPLTPTYPPSNSQSLSPTGPPAPQQQPVYDAPGQRVGYEAPRSTYEGNRSFDQTQSRAYEGARTGYDHATQRGSYDTNARSSYDSQAQRSSFGQPYDAPTQSCPDGQGPPHPYPHHQASYSGAQQQNHASPTHTYSPHASSSQQTQQQPTHDSPYPPPPPPSRFQSQYATPPIHNYGQPAPYTQTQQNRYDYSQQPQHYGSGAGAGAYYDSPQSQAATASGAVQQDPQQPQQQSYYAPSHSSSGHSSSSWGTPSAAPGTGTTAGPASTHPQQPGHSQGYATPAPSQGSYDYSHASQSYSGNSGGTGEFYSHTSAASSSHAPPRGGSPDSSPISAGGTRYGAAGAGSGYPNGEPYPRTHPHPHTQAQVQQHAFSQHEWATGASVQGARSASASAPTSAGWGSVSAGSTGTAGEMIHLAPLRHVHGHSPTPSSPGAGGGGGPGPGPGPGYSALLPGAPHAHPHAQVHPHAHGHVQNQAHPHALPHAHSPVHGHAHVHGGHAHVSFEGEAAPAIAGTRGIGGAGGGKKSVLSIGSIISEGG